MLVLKRAIRRAKHPLEGYLRAADAIGWANTRDDDDLARRRAWAAEALEQARIHDQIEGLRRREKGRISARQKELSARLADVLRVLGEADEMFEGLGLIEEKLREIAGTLDIGFESANFNA
jgi:hypothetical protein